jgi:RNA polymerase sigma-70 factor (ECF subfamily)
MSVTLAELSVPMLATPGVRDALDPESARLAALARTGDREAFGALLERHLAAARRVARAAVSRPSDADEAVQDASVAAWQRLDSLHENGAFRAWFLRIVWRKALDRRRSFRTWLTRFGGAETGSNEAPLPDASTSEPGPEAAFLAGEFERAAASVIRSLPGRLRDPFLLAASGDHRYEEIATLLGIPVGTVKWRISEARRVIRGKLDRIGYGGGR